MVLYRSSFFKDRHLSYSCSTIFFNQLVILMQPTGYINCLLNSVIALKYSVNIVWQRKTKIYNLRCSVWNISMIMQFYNLFLILDIYWITNANNYRRKLSESKKVNHTLLRIIMRMIQRSLNTQLWWTYCNNMFNLYSYQYLMCNNKYAMRNTFLFHHQHKLIFAYWARYFWLYLFLIPCFGYIDFLKHNNTCIMINSK